MKSPSCNVVVTCIRAFCGFSACPLTTESQDTVRVYPKGFRKDHVWAPYGPLWISYGLGNVRTIMYAGIVRARTDAIYGLGNSRMISHAGPYGARRIP